VKLSIKGSNLLSLGDQVMIYRRSWHLDQPYTHEVTFDGSLVKTDPPLYGAGFTAVWMEISWREKCD